MKKVFYVPFGADFLDALHRFIKEDKKELSHSAIVFAGKRPSLYLKKRLIEGADKPLYPPQFFSIEEFIDFIARKQYPDFTDIEYVDAIWLIYQCIQSLPSFADHPFRKKGFSDFFWWGRYLLGFINQLDIENIDNEKARSLEKNAELGYDVPESTNAILTHVTLLREAFHGTLLEKRFFTTGYKHLCALKRISESIPDDFEKIYFAGLFALSATEKRIIRHLWSVDKADIILEGDPAQWPILTYFVSFLEADVQPLPCDARSHSTQIHTGIDTHSECLTTYDILRDTLQGRTAIVLPSPDTLFPLLSFAIDRIDTPYNISLGYPLSRTSLFDLIVHVLNAQAQKRMNNQYPTGKYLSIMLHPFVKNLEMEGTIRPVLADLEKRFSEDILENTLASKPFITLTEIEEVLFKNNADPDFIKIHSAFFQDFERANTLYDYAELLGNLFDFILRHTPVRSYALSGEIFREFYEALENLKHTQFSTSMLHSNEVENRRVICDFIREHLKSMKLPFETKPIEDLEIIGVLESRNICFDTVIMLDVNEGIMPQAKKINPLIPLGIYNVLGIPSPEYNEEIFRYYFYRLIRSARNVHLLYIDSEEKPRSRYIEQLIWERERATQTINAMKINKTACKINVTLQSKPPVIEKTEKIRKILKEKIFSPSAIDDYVACPILFYFKQILRFEEKRVLGDDIEAMDRGTIIHSILHDTFDGYLNKEITPLLCNEMLTKMRGIIARHFETRETNGDYYLFKRLTVFKLESFLRKNIDEANGPFIVKYLETSIEDTMDINGHTVRIKGRIDRIDYHPHTNGYIIADYKTGGMKQYPRRITNRVDFQSMQSIRERIRSFQLPLYVYLFMNRFGVPLTDINAKLILLRNNDEETLFGGLAPDEKETLFAQFMEGTATVVKDLLDPAKPFVPFDMDSCRTCAFSNLCHV